MTNLVAFGKPLLIFNHDRANAQFILAKQGTEFVIAKLALPDINGVSEEFFGIVFRSSNYEEAVTQIRRIIRPNPLAVVGGREYAEAA